MEILDNHLAFLLLRLALGINIFLHGVVRLRVGSKKFSDFLVKDFADTPLHPRLIALFGHGLPTLETALGLLIILGLFSQSVLLIGGLLIAILLIGKSLQSDWQTVSFQMIYVLIYSILLWARSANYYSLDTFIFHK